MTDPSLLLAVASTATLGVALTSAALLRGWQEWLDIRQMRIGRGGFGRASAANGEIAELRRRVRRLEEIANGADR